MLRALAVRLRALLRQGVSEAELDEELRYHLEREAERNVAAGMSPGDAVEAARRAFGNPTSHAEAGRAAWGWTWLEQAWQDLRYGARALRRSPVFTMVAVMSLGIGIGANTAVFNLLHGILMTPLAVTQPERLVDLVQVDTHGPDRGMSYPAFEALRAVPGISMATSRALDNVSIAVGQQEDFTNVELVDGGYYGVLGLTPRFGRLIGPGEFQRAEHVAVLAEPVAARWFGTADRAVGRTMSIRGVPFTVIGVTPEAWRGIEYPGWFTVAVPLSASPALGEHDYRAGDERIFDLFGRLAPGATPAALEPALTTLLRRCCAREASERVTLADMSLGIGGGKDDVRNDFAPVLEALMAGVAVLLLIACANVGNLLLLRAAARRREIAVRMSLGSSRGRILRQLLTESLLLTVLAVGAALLIAAWATRVLVAAIPDMGDAYPAMIRFHPDLPIVGFTLLTGLLSLLLFGLVPALRATRSDLHEELKAGSRTARSGTGLLGRGLVAVQVALALVLVSCAALLVATLRNLGATDIGVKVAQLSAMGVETRGTVLESRGVVPFTPEILRSARATPGVVAAGAATVAPLFGGRWASWPLETGTGGEAPDALMAGISPGYLETVGVRIAAGRDFTGLDGSGGEQVAMLSRSLARTLFGTEDVVGRILRLRGDSVTPLRIVAVVGDVSLKGPREGNTPTFYRPLAQMGRWPYVDLLIREQPGGQGIMASVAAAVRSAAPGVRVRNAATAADRLRAWLLREVLLGSLATIFGVLALVLAAMGIYGVIAYNVALRTGEIGVRMALGAAARDVVALVMRSSFALTGIGVLVGGPLVFFAGRAMRAMLFGVGAHDPVMLLASLAILVLVTAAATAVPAMRASRIDPLIALRAD
ncbi:MAG TPA: ADOP family duplicated permease [Gemmatimonadales bacterium]|jgi:predicted permease